MQCFICKEEITDKRRKKCPACGAQLSLSKYEHNLFAWTANDKKKVKELKDNYFAEVANQRVEFEKARQENVRREKQEKIQEENRRLEEQRKADLNKTEEKAAAEKKAAEERRKAEEARRVEQRRLAEHERFMNKEDWTMIALFIGLDLFFCMLCLVGGFFFDDSINNNVPVYLYLCAAIIVVILGLFLFTQVVKDNMRELQKTVGILLLIVINIAFVFAMIYVLKNRILMNGVSGLDIIKNLFK